MDNIRINPAMFQAAAGKVQTGKDTSAKVTDAVKGEVTRLGNEKEADRFIKMTATKDASKSAPANPKVSARKKIGAGIASAIVPGLGQAVNGQWGKALGFFIGVGLSDTVGFVLGGPVGMVAAHVAMDVWNIVDAYRNAN